MDIGFFNGGGGVSEDLYIQHVSPATGDTVESDAGDRDSLLWVQPGVPLNSLTIILPPNVESNVGQIIYIGSSRNVGELTIGGADIIYSAPIAFSAGDLLFALKVDNNVWAFGNG